GEAGEAAALEERPGVRPRVFPAGTDDATVRLLAHRTRLVAVLSAEGAHGLGPFVNDRAHRSARPVARAKAGPGAGLVTVHRDLLPPQRIELRGTKEAAAAAPPASATTRSATPVARTGVVFVRRAARCIIPHSP